MYFYVFIHTSNSAVKRDTYNAALKKKNLKYMSQKSYWPWVSVAVGDAILQNIYVS